MEKRIAQFIVCLIVVCLSSSVVVALAPMGPPKAMLGQDRWDIGIEYGYRTMDLEAVGNVTDIQVDPEFITVRKGKHNIDNLKSNIVMARAGYGINDNWDAFVRLGVADAESDMERIYPDGSPSDEYGGFEGSFGFAWGFGTRATFWQDDDVSWGGLLQMTWSEPDDSDISLAGDSAFTGTAEINFWEVQIAIGPTVRLDDNFRVYGGPFLHFVNGDLDLSGKMPDEDVTEIRLEVSGDIEEKSQFGGYAGAHFDVDENTSCFIEGQLTGDAWAVGTGIAWRF